jgi:hypothetical protein
VIVYAESEAAPCVRLAVIVNEPEEASPGGTWVEHVFPRNAAWAAYLYSFFNNWLAPVRSGSQTGENGGAYAMSH